MRFSIFKTKESKKGVECTYERYLELTNSKQLLRLCNDIAAEKDEAKRNALKGKLPGITWQAYFPGRRVSDEAVPSGLYVVDIDHEENPHKLFNDKIVSKIDELDIVYVGLSASRHGLHIVAKCQPMYTNIEENQRWLTQQLGIPFDKVCKDWARFMYQTHDSYTYYMNAKGIWQDEPKAVFEVPKGNTTCAVVPGKKAASGKSDAQTADQQEPQQPIPTEYKGVPYDDIIKEWFYHTGGEPTEGERNVRLYQLALRLRYITDFNEATLLAVMPNYGLAENEMREIVRHSLSTTRGQNIPRDLQETLDLIDKRVKIMEGDDEEIPEIITSTEKIPTLPPIFRQWAEIAPDDFKQACVLCQLPILGALGSRLRARYIDGKMHSPSFQVSLEAPQASGKSFIVALTKYELASMMESDEANREKEREWTEKAQQFKLTNTKLTQKQHEELGEKPKGIIRYVPPTISITMLLKRMDAAQGLHLFALSEEIDTVQKAFSRGFSNFSEALRVAFDNGLYGQDYASENSWSGNVALYYNCLFSGTPLAMRRFYRDVEDGLVSRVLFVTLPDQFGKPMPRWGAFDDRQQRMVDLSLEKLNAVTLQGDRVQPEHEMNLDFLNIKMEKWVKAQQVEAIRQDDRTRDIFCRRSAVVGFRAGMLAWFLWDEKESPTVRRNVSNFAVWVANSMLNQHLLRFQIDGTGSNINRWESVLKELPDEFTREQLQQLLDAKNFDTPVRTVVYRWKLAGLIEGTEKDSSNAIGRKGDVKFIKLNH